MIPYPFQTHDLATLKDANYVAMLNLQTGAGKTALATWSIRDSGAERTLVVCPAQTMANAWVSTVQEILGLEAREIGNTGKAKKQALWDFEWGAPGVYMVTPQLLARTDSSRWTGDMLICDESHTQTSVGTRTQRRLCGLTPDEGQKSLVRRFDGRLMLSGTLLRNRFQTAWSYGRALWWEQNARDQIAYDNFWVWSKDRCIPHTVYTSQRDANGKPKTVIVYEGEREPGRWISEAPCVITHLKRERCCEFHPEGFLPLDAPVVREEVIPLCAEQKRIIHELEKMSMTWLEDNPLVVDLSLTQKQRIRQAILGVLSITSDEDVYFAEDCQSPFIDRLLEMLNEEMEDETCVVFMDSQRFASVVTARLNKAGVKAFEYSGKTRSVRDDNLKRFGSEFRVMAGVIAASGSGLDSLQHVTNNEVILARSLDETENEQMRGRLDRMGQKRQVMRWVFHDDLGISEGNYGDAIAKRLQLNKSLKRA